MPAVRQLALWDDVAEGAGAPAGEGAEDEASAPPPPPVAREQLGLWGAPEVPVAPGRPQGMPPPDVAPLVPTDVYDTYWYLAAERQRIFFRRVHREAPPLTDDPILARYKFTNAYRASDRVSQYLIRHVLYGQGAHGQGAHGEDAPGEDAPGADEPDEVFFRTLLFKLFNRIATWELLEDRVGPVRWATYDFERYDAVLASAMASGQAIYSAAYMMASGKSAFGHARKHQNHLRLLEAMMADDLPARLQDAPTMQAAFDLLRAYPTIGDFLAYQYVTDLNYGPLTDFSERTFVVPGPGARDGIRKCFRDLGGLSEPDVIRFMCARQEAEFERLGLDFPSLWGRPLQYIDCQNLFCEVDKYARVAHPEVEGLSGRTQIKQTYTRHPRPIRYFYPPAWGLNDKVAATLQRAERGAR